MKRNNYASGELTRRRVGGLESSPLSQKLIEIGFYNGNYRVVKELNRRLHPSLETVFSAAQLTWKNRSMSLEEIIEWVRKGSINPSTNEQTLSFREDEELYETINLINYGLFERLE